MELEKINFTCVAEIVLHIEKKKQTKWKIQTKNRDGPGWTKISFLIFVIFIFFSNFLFSIFFKFFRELKWRIKIFL